MGKKLCTKLSSWAQHVKKTICVKLRRFSAKHKLLKSTKASKKAASVDVHDPYSYTAGRWPNRDKLELEARRLVFDFDALCAVVFQLCPGATKVAQYEKHEGSFNRVFILELDNGMRIVARLPTRITGPPRLTTNPEVATMAYLTKHTSIPIPKVLDWSDDSSNPTGTEYIIMEHVAGVRLCERWETMSVVEHLSCVDAITRMMGEMADITFSAYGSLYFTNAPIDNQYKIDLGDRFCLGPNCGARYWNADGDVGSVSPANENKNLGPWLDLSSYCAGLIDTEFDNFPKALPDGVQYPPYHGSIEEHIRLLGISKDVIAKLTESPSIQNAAAPTLLHADLHMRNILVSMGDPKVVTGLIDWQWTSVEPAFVHMREEPDFAAITALPKGYKLPSKGDLVTPLDEDAWNIIACAQVFDAVCKGQVPKLYRAKQLNKTLLRPLHYCDKSWSYSVAAIRNEMIKASTRWTELGIPGFCPYIPTEDELKEHKKQYDDIEVAEKLKSNLKELLDCRSDGWVPADQWEWAKKRHKQLFVKWVKHATNPIPGRDDVIPKEKARLLWPFDER